MRGARDVTGVRGRGLLVLNLLAKKAGGGAGGLWCKGAWPWVGKRRASFA